MHPWLIHVNVWQNQYSIVKQNKVKTKTNKQKKNPNTSTFKNEDNGTRSHHFMANRWETMETVAEFIFLGFKITADGDCSHEIKRHLLLERTFMIKVDSILKSRDITLPTKVCLTKAMVFPVVMYGCESWTIKKPECERINVLNYDVGEDS